MRYEAKLFFKSGNEKQLVVPDKEFDSNKGLLMSARAVVRVARLWEGVLELL